MLTANSCKTKQFLLVLIKIGLVVAAFYFIYTKLFNNNDLKFNEFVHNLMSSSLISTNTVFILCFLSTFNWFFEILKWQTLVNRITKISFQEATTQSLGAHTASLFTPNRIGDYGAKAMYYQPQLRKKIMFLNLVGNSSQMAITTISGAFGFVYFTLQFQPELNYPAFPIWFAVIGLLITILSVWILKKKWLKKQRKLLYKLLEIIKDIPKKTFFKIGLFSLIRYLMFSFQFYYMLFLFGIELNYAEAMIIISTMYLLSSIIPSIFIFDVVIKGGIAVYLFGLIGVPETIVLSVVTFMWILNFVLPSVIGSYHVLTFRLPKTAS